MSHTKTRLWYNSNRYIATLVYFLCAQSPETAQVPETKETPTSAQQPVELPTLSAATAGGFKQLSSITTDSSPTAAGLASSSGPGEPTSNNSSAASETRGKLDEREDQEAELESDLDDCVVVTHHGHLPVHVDNSLSNGPNSGLPAQSASASPAGEEEAELESDLDDCVVVTRHGRLPAHAESPPLESVLESDLDDGLRMACKGNSDSPKREHASADSGAQAFRYDANTDTCLLPQGANTNSNQSDYPEGRSELHMHPIYVKDGKRLQVWVRLASESEPGLESNGKCSAVGTDGHGVPPAASAVDIEMGKTSVHLSPAAAKLTACALVNAIALMISP
jgi:hypothetical protein